MKSQIRTGLLTFILGVASVPFFTPLIDKWREPYVELPQIESQVPIVVRVCPELPAEEIQKSHRERGYILVRQISGIDCNPFGGGSGGGNGGRNNEPASVGRYVNDVYPTEGFSTGYGGGGGSGGQTCDEFIKSLGKLNKKSLQRIAKSPCRNEVIR